MDPRAFVVPDDADRCAPGRIGDGKEAAQERGPRQGQNQDGCEARARSTRTDQSTLISMVKTLLNVLATELRANTTSV
jgi:hypothetical protein